jgi:hypothetical protein
MKATIIISGKEIPITLTKDQADQINGSLTIMDKIQTWEAAAEYIGLDPLNDLPFRAPQNNRQIACNAFFMADVITEALLEGVVLDWTNTEQKKWTFWMNNYQSGSGFVFYDTYYGWTGANAGGGARLYLDTEEKVLHFAKYFMPIINQFSNPNK